jgi:hypothetical protein
MAVNLTGIVGDMTSLIPSSTDILQQVIIGAGASVALAGLKSQAGIDAVDPLHIFHKDGGSTVVGKTISGAAFSAMAPDARAQLIAAGYTVV